MIFVVDDEKHILQLIKYNLEENGYRVKTFEDGEVFLKEIGNTTPDLFILDIMLPGKDGLELCRKIRQDYRTKKIPIMMVTAKGEEFDKVLGLELGADDYLSKPFSVRELVARVKALFRRVGNSELVEGDVFKHEDILIDCERREVYKKGNLIELTYKEYELFKMLVMYKGKVLSREKLLEKIWGYDFTGETRTVDVHIRYLRQKIEDDSDDPVYIETVRGVGYRFADKKK
ncbi:MAG: response regulator transcription factor [Clostridia bacterium]|nr:response regulator transcription factor [Clostridia bacterium]MDD4048173.1 response regulator transcription factor [Clostridia bacterium]